MIKFLLIALLTLVVSFLFTSLLFFIFAIVTTVINNIGKDEFKWYAFCLNYSYPKTHCFDSFREMMKYGNIMNLKMSAGMTVLLMIVGLYVMYKG